MFELVIVWSDGNKNIYEYNSQKEAEQAGENMKMALGNQIVWFGTRRKER